MTKTCLVFSRKRKNAFFRPGHALNPPTLASLSWYKFAMFLCELQQRQRELQHQQRPSYLWASWTNCLALSSFSLMSLLKRSWDSKKSFRASSSRCSLNNDSWARFSSTCNEEKTLISSVLLNKYSFYKNKRA